MADLKDLISPSIREYQLVTGIWFGSVVAPLPLQERDFMYVVLDDIDVNTKWGPLRWMPRFKKVAGVIVQDLPVLGSEVIAVFDNRQTLWVPAWW